MKFVKLKKAAAFFILCSFIISCNNSPDLNFIFPVSAEAGQLKIDADSIRLVGDPGHFSVEKTVHTESEGVQLITFSFKSEKPSAGLLQMIKQFLPGRMVVILRV